MYKKVTIILIKNLFTKISKFLRLLELNKVAECANYKIIQTEFNLVIHLHSLVKRFIKMFVLQKLVFVNIKILGAINASSNRLHIY